MRIAWLSAGRLCFFLAAALVAGAARADIDNTAPVITPPSPIVFNVPFGSMGTPVTFGGCTATDDSMVPPNVVNTPGSGSFFPIGQTTVNCTATDRASNSSSSSFTVTLIEDPPPTSSLTVQKTGSGNGTVTSSLSGISCGATCSFSYSNNTQVTLSASATPGSSFTGWSGGGCMGTSSCVVTLTSATTVYANFDLVPDSPKVDALQHRITPLVAQTSGAAINGAIGDSVASSFGGGAPVVFGPNGFALNFAAEPSRRRAQEAFSALSYAEPRKPAPVYDKRLIAWADVRGTGWNGSGTAEGIDGWQVNVTAGLGFKLRTDFIVGLVGGYETFSYDDSSLAGKLTGSGGSAGAYLGWRPSEGIRLDLAGVWSRINYAAMAGMASGAFSGDRWLGSAGLTANQSLGGFLLEPSARLFALWESEAAWTDNLATAHAARSFHLGRASVGARLSYPMVVGDGGKVVPYLGAFGDYRFGDEDAPGVSDLVGFDNGLSGRATAGIGFTSVGGVSLALGGEIGGLGSDFLTWSGTARGAVRF